MTIPVSVDREDIKGNKDKKVLLSSVKCVSAFWKCIYNTGN